MRDLDPQQRATVLAALDPLVAHRRANATHADRFTFGIPVHDLTTGQLLNPQALLLDDDQVRSLQRDIAAQAPVPAQVDDADETVPGEDERAAQSVSRPRG